MTSFPDTRRRRSMAAVTRRPLRRIANDNAPPTMAERLEARCEAIVAAVQAEIDRMFS